MMKPDLPESSGRTLTVRFWGTRGSLPRPGTEMARYGGNTACVEIRVGSRLFIVDAGSGIEAFGRGIVDPAPSFDLLLSHLHHDHILGLPFFAPAFNRAATINTYCGNLDGESAAAAFDQMFAPPLFPVRLEQFPCRFEHRGFRAGTPLVFADGITVRTCPLPHPGGATAYRFELEGQAVCYVSDLEHDANGPSDLLVAFCADADLVIYDAMFNEGEYQACRGWGHSTWPAGVALCKASGARALAATHHHLRHTDVMLERMEADLRVAMPGSFFAREGQTIALSPHKARRVKRPGRTLERVV